MAQHITDHDRLAIYRLPLRKGGVAEDGAGAVEVVGLDVFLQHGDDALAI